MSARASLQVSVVKRTTARVSAARLTRVLKAAAAALKVEGEVALVLGSDRLVRGLNRDYRGQDQATDVLSFEGGAEVLGDIAISVETARRNAKALGRSLAQELDVLALHGFLHVLGHDHETDQGQMNRLERRLRRKLLGEGVAGPGTGAAETGR